MTENLNEVCHSFLTGADGVDEAKLIGGFQDVATLLNCLTGQASTQSPARRHSKQHKPAEQRPTLTPFNISSGKPDGALTSPSRTHKEGADEGHTVPVITDYDTGIHASLIYRKCNSLPRARAPKIFVNNLHNFSRSPERSMNSLEKKVSTPSADDTCATEGCQREHKCCDTIMPTASGSEDFPPARAGAVCLACSATTHTDHHCQHGGAPRRSKSFSTVSYIASPGGGCPCTDSRSPPGPLCSVSATKPKGCSAPDQRSPVTSSCSYTTNTTPVVFSKTSKTYTSGELFLL